MAQFGRRFRYGWGTNPQLAEHVTGRSANLDNLRRSIRNRRAVGFAVLALIVGIDIFATGFFGGSERALAMARTIVLPGLPSLEWNWVIGVATVAATLFAIYAWMRWGMDWLLLLVVAASLAVATFVMPIHEHGVEAEAHHHAQLDREAMPAKFAPGSQYHETMFDRAETPEFVHAGHEFLIVLVIFTALAKLRLFLSGYFNNDWFNRFIPDSVTFPARDVVQASAFLALADPGDASLRGGLSDWRVVQRARRINWWARLRRWNDPLEEDHAPTRAALALAGLLSEDQQQRLREEAAGRIAGVPDSEPSWIRPLDGMLAAIALKRMGETECVERWVHVFQTCLTLHGGRRSAALHRPSMMAIGTAPAWEQAAAAALAFREGWIGDEDWTALRGLCLGAAAGGDIRSEAIRLVAAGQLWAVLTGDEEALKLLRRRTFHQDNIASAIAVLSESTAGALQRSFRTNCT